ncbi:hypothetical protein TNCV_4310261 [Trichonephila clavipes]|nr:hypothetical protein TNCV_4310261 [Trichonephila clavipes]
MGKCRSYRPRKRKFHGNQNTSTETASSNEEIITASSLKLQQCNEVNNDIARWTTEEVSALINIWGDQSIQQQFDGTVRDSEVYKKICEKLRKNGYARTFPQIRSKLYKAA